MRRIDSKFHIENEQIIKTSNGEAIPEDEPCFLIRARDYLALPLLRHYRELCVDDGCTEFQIAGNDAAIAEFERFSMEHRERLKQPGMTTATAKPK